MVFLKEFYANVDFKKISRQQKKHALLPNRQRVRGVQSIKLSYNPAMYLLRFLLGITNYHFVLVFILLDNYLDCICVFQRKHALRAYSQALQIYKGKNWALAEVNSSFLLLYRLN